MKSEKVVAAQEADEHNSKAQIEKLVKDFVQREGELLRLAYKLRAFEDARDVVRDSYLFAVLDNPEQLADDCWALLASGPEPADYFDVILLNLPAASKQFDVAENLLEYAKQRGWEEEVQKILNSDCHEMLAARKERHDALMVSAGVEAVN